MTAPEQLRLGSIDTRSYSRPVGQGELVYNVKDFGAAGDGLTDDTAAISATIEAMPSIANSFGGVSGVLYFPAGRYIDSGQRVIPSTKKMRIVGDGPETSIWYRKSGSLGDFLTIRAKSTGVENICFDGNRNGTVGSGDLLVLDSAYCYVRNSALVNSYGNAITIGKTSSGIGARLCDVDIRLPRGYGILVVGSSGSTDGQWANVIVGQAGLSGVRISTGAQQISNLHAWGCGLESNTDHHGIWLNSQVNHLINCESETNLGNGVYIGGPGSDGNSLCGGWYWGNVGAGLYGFSANRVVLSGNSLYNNGVTNTTGATSPSFAAIHNESGMEWAVSGNQMYDTGSAVPAGSYTTQPTFPYPGRSAALTQSYAYADANKGSGVPNFHSITGNLMRAARTRSGMSNIVLGLDSQLSGNVM